MSHTIIDKYKFIFFLSISPWNLWFCVGWSISPQSGTISPSTGPIVHCCCFLIRWTVLRLNPLSSNKSDWDMLKIFRLSTRIIELINLDLHTRTLENCSYHYQIVITIEIISNLLTLNWWTLIEKKYSNTAAGSD